MKWIILSLMALSTSGCFPRAITVRVVNDTNNQVRDLEMDNAALRAANEYLRRGY